MFTLLCFILAVLVAPFKSKNRLEAENAALRRQLIVLRRKVYGRAWLMNNDCLCVPKTSSGDNFGFAGKIPCSYARIPCSFA